MKKIKNNYYYARKFCMNCGKVVLIEQKKGIVIRKIDLNITACDNCECVGCLK